MMEEQDSDRFIQDKQMSDIILQEPSDQKDNKYNKWVIKFAEKFDSNHDKKEEMAKNSISHTINSIVAEQNFLNETFVIVRDYS